LTTERTITVAHTAEVAHRLFLTPGKCARIHGHGLRIQLTLIGEVDENGLLAGIEFGHLKREFRGFIDHYLDHQCLLNKVDPFAQPLFADAEGNQPEGLTHHLPGMRACEADPTTENLAMWIGQWARTTFAVPLVFAVAVQVEETPVNAGNWSGPMESLSDYCLTDILGRMVKSETLHPVFYPGGIIPAMPQPPLPAREQQWAVPHHLKDVPTGDHPEPMPPGA
jgi:6-pyruvoyl-tetrahydropterin synthase